MNSIFKKYIVGIILLMSITMVGCQKNDYVIDDSFERLDIYPDEIKDSEVLLIKDDYHLVWSDEFNYTGAPDSTKWSYEVGTGNGGWGNNESQFYTNRLENSSVSDGCLKITARKEEYSGSNYTSARLVTRNNGDFKYGYIEVMAKMPSGVGTWPAIWMMPTESVYGTWPASGEIDILEYRGSKKDYIFSTVHTQNNHGSGITSGYKYYSGIEENFNKYALEWSEDYLKFYFNDILIHQYNNPNRIINPENSWPFDQKFFLILNIAMGGTLGGTISPDFISSSMYVDYVRVYQKNLDGVDQMSPEMTKITNTIPSSSSISISWDECNDDYGVKQYDVIVNGVQVGATTKTDYLITDLEPNTEYTIQVLAVDHANNFSVSLPVVVQTTDILRAPGKIEVEQFVHTNNAFTLSNPNGSLSVDLSNINNENGYIICEVFASEGTYELTINLMVPRFKNSIFIYTVDESFNGQKTNEIKLTANAGKYVEINPSITLDLVEGVNYIKIESYSETIGKIATIDFITLNKK